MSETTTDVAVVGAGPTGLMLAGDLAEGGARVTLLEQREQGSTLTRAFAVHARTLEQLDARGLADDLLATGATVDALRLFDSVSVSLAPLPSRFPFLLVTPQSEVERLLLDRAQRLGVEVVRGARVTGLHRDADAVILDHEHLDGPTSRRLSARYAVGTDGHHSTVRRLLGLEFPGEAVVRSLVLADVRLSRPPSALLTVEGNRHGFCFVVPFGDGWWRVIARDPRRELPDDAPVTLAELSDTARRVLGTDLGLHDPRWMSRFHSEERQVERYRVDRVLLAGDAAHVHSPAGGMGMNTGLQDAANLGWRLAAVVRGDGPEDLLDGYDAERRPVGAMVVRTSGGLIRAAMVRAPAARVARNALMRVALALPPVARRMRGRVSGIAIAYPAPPGAHALAGRRAPDLVGADGRRLYAALRGGRFVLVAPASTAYADRPRLAVLPRRDSDPGPAVLVRPDGHVAWAGAPGPALAAALETALRDWGLPVTARHTP